MSTTVIYNGVTLANVSTREWDETIEFDESGTDAIGIRFRLTFDCIVHQQAIPVSTSPIYADDGGAHPTPTSRLVKLKRRLKTPRKQLKVLFGTDVALLVNPYSGQSTVSGVDQDINLGPKPTKVSIYHIAADKCFRIRFSIEAMTLDCDKNRSGSAAFALNNRWSIRESMDENFAITRSITGTLKLAASSLPGGSFPTYAYRSLCFPGLEDGFRRASVTFQQDVAGNKLNYEIIDIQTRYAPPYPATRMSGRHGASTIDGYRFIQHVQVQLTGPPHCDVRDLLQRAVQVCQYRLNYENTSGETLNGNQRIVEASIIESIGDVPTIDVSIRVEEIGGTARTALTRTRNRTIGTMQLPPLGRLNTETNEAENLKSTQYSVTKHPIPAIYGYDEWRKERSPLAIAFFQCVLQSPCDGAAAIGGPPTAPTSASERRGIKVRLNESKVFQLPTVAGLNDPTIAGTWPDGHLDAMYITVAMNNVYDKDECVVRLPVANGSRSSNQPTATIVRLSQPTATRIVTVDFERVGEFPELPPFRSHQLEHGETILHAAKLKLEILPPRYTADANRTIHRVRATYVYLGDRDIPIDAVLPIGRLPIMGSKVSDRVQLDKLLIASGKP